MEGGGDHVDYVIATVEVDLDKLEKLDTKNSSKEKDLVTVKMPSVTNVCKIQLWEVYVAAAILILQPHSSVIFAHVEALCEHTEQTHLCEAILKEHLTQGTVIDQSQDISMFSFFDEYFHRKFQISFAKGSLHQYIEQVMDDPLCGKDKIPRTFLIGPHLQAFLLNSQYFEGQYDELIDAMRMASLPVNDILQDGEKEIGEAVDIQWDNVRLYDDPNLILKKHGGWAVTKAARILTPKDQLMIRLTGCTLEQIMAGMDVPDSPRREHMEIEEELNKIKRKDKRLQTGATEGGGDVADDDSDHPSAFDVDPVHEKIQPIGISITETFLLLHGLFMGQEKSSSEFRGCVVGDSINASLRDGHILAAAVLIDLYMREQIDVHHWTLSEGNIAVPYQVVRKKRQAPLEHWLDAYSHHAENIFRDMRLPAHIGEAPIWQSLEHLGVIENHRPSWERAYGCGFRKVDVWDLARPDLLLDFKEGYLLAARVLYDKDFPDPLDNEANDMLMYTFVVQNLFDRSMDAIDGMTRVLKDLCSPFEKGEMYAPVTQVHSGAVCLGLIEHGFRFANGQNTDLAQEAAEFNEEVMHRLETKFFLSPKVWESFDEDHSGELSLEEFVEGMRNIDVYKDFRKERVPDDVLRMIVSDLAERLFHEVDINMDGTLTPAELQIAFKRRHDEAVKTMQRKQWFRNTLRSVALQVGYKEKKLNENGRKEANELKDETEKEAHLLEQRTRHEWTAEVERPELLGEMVDIDATYTTNT